MSAHMKQAGTLLDGYVRPKLRIGIALLIRTSAPRISGILREVSGTSFDGFIASVRPGCWNRDQFVVPTAENEDG
jgi:hypothetical protein